MKVGLFLPHYDTGGALRVLKDIARMIFHGSRAEGCPVDLVVSVVAGYDVEREFGDLSGLGVAIRETRWQAISADEVRTALLSIGEQRDLRSPSYWLPVDFGFNFHDCDFWLIASERTDYPVAPVKPYAMVIPAYVQRYVPEFFEGQPLECDMNDIVSARGAEFVLTNTKAGAEDIVQYAGVPREKVAVVPTIFSAFVRNVHIIERSRPYFIWATNSSQHKNHLRALDALEYYFEKLHGELDVVVTGRLTELFMARPGKRSKEQYDHPYPASVRQRVAASESLRGRVHFHGHLSDQDYVNTLAQASFLFHPALYRNGAFSVLEAACYGVSSVVSRCPQMQEIDKEFGLQMRFCDPYRIEDMARQLREMDVECRSGSRIALDKKRLTSSDAERMANSYWQVIGDRIIRAGHA